MPGVVTALDVSEEVRPDEFCIHHHHWNDFVYACIAIDSHFTYFGMQVLSCFWDLAAIEGEKRAEATSRLLEHLQLSQNDAPGTSSTPATGEGPSPSALDVAVTGCSPLVAYSIRRLYKGLTSGRKGARQGFALALTAALKQLTCFQAENLLALVESMNEIAIGGGRDEFFGQIFGLGAIIRARKMEPAVATAIAEQAIGLAHKKSFLREAAATLIIELAERNPDCMNKVLSEGRELRAWLSAPCDQACPEALALALRLWRHMPKELQNACKLLPSCSSVPTASLFATGRKGKDKNDKAVAAAFFSEAHLKRLAPVLKATTQSHPRLNIVWTTLLIVLLPGYVGAEEKKKEVQKAVAVASPELDAFWSVLVEGDIFESTSHERKYLGCTLFEHCLPAIK